MMTFSRSKALCAFAAVAFPLFLLLPNSLTAKDFDFVYIGQSSYQNLNVVVGGKSDDYLTLTIKNSGTKTWYKYGTGSPVINIGPEPKDQSNWFACSGDGWAGSDRISMYKNAQNGSSLVAPGELALFSFKVCPGNNTPTGLRKFYVTPVAEGIEWMGSPIIYWEINVVSQQTPTTPPQQTQPVPEPAPQPQPILRADFLSETVPDGTNFDVGQSFDKSWRIRNSGNTAWSDCKLVFVSGNRMGAPNQVTVGYTNPGSEVTIQVPMDAPTSAGQYRSDWQLVSPDGKIIPVSGSQTIWAKIAVRAATPTPPVAQPEPTPQPEPEPEPVPAPQPQPILRADFLSETVPDGTNFDSGWSFNKSWRIRNSGNTAWSGCKLVFVSGNRMGAPNQVTVGYTNPGSEVTIQVPMDAPTSAGQYRSDWQLVSPDGKIIPVSGSQTIWAKIAVRAATPPPPVVQPEPAPQPIPAPQPQPILRADFLSETVPDGTNFDSGWSFNKSWRIRNSGNTAWSGCKLVFVSGNRMGAPNQVTVGYTNPGSEVTIQVPMDAPTSAGQYRNDWQLVSSDGKVIPVSGSQTIWAKITVRASAPPPPVVQPEPTPQPVPEPAPQPQPILRADFLSETVPDGTYFDSGWSFNKSWRIRNSGNTAWSDCKLVFVSGNRMGAPNQVTVGYTNPGSEVTIQVPMDAPTSAGQYRSDWQLVSPDGKVIPVSGSQTIWAKIAVRAATPPPPVVQPEPTPQPEPEPAPQPQPILRAEFLSETVPDGTNFDAGWSFNKSWRIRNSGNTAWSDCKLVFVSGNRMGAPNQVTVGYTNPGSEVTIQVPMDAPTSAGQYRSDWQLVSPDGKVIPVSGSQTIWAKIAVRAATPTPPVAQPQPIPQPEPEPEPAPQPQPILRAEFLSETVPDGTNFDAGRSFNKSWRIRNSGNTAWSGCKLVFVSGNRMGAPNQVTVGYTNPGSEVTIQVPMDAPTSAGQYRSDWQFVSPDGKVIPVSGSQTIWAKIAVRGSATPPSVDQPLPRPQPVPQPQPTLKAELLGETVDDGTEFNAGQSIDKSWLIRNSGNTAWTNFKLKFVSGNRMGAPNQVTVGSTNPGSEVKIQLPMKAPTTSGKYESYWQLVSPDGKVVPVSGSQTIWAMITVRASATQPPIDEPLPRPQPVPQPKIISVYSRNVGALDINSYGKLVYEADEKIKYLKSELSTMKYDIITFQEMGDPTKQASDIFGTEYQYNCWNYECIATKKNRFTVNTSTHWLPASQFNNFFHVSCKDDAVPIYIDVTDNSDNSKLRIINVHFNSPIGLGEVVGYNCQVQQYSQMFERLVRPKTLIVGDFNLSLDTFPELADVAKSYRFNVYKGDTTVTGSILDYLMSNFSGIAPCYPDSSMMGATYLYFDHPGISCYSEFSGGGGGGNGGGGW